MNKIIVKIANQEYSIIGNEEKDYILSLASHVDEQISKASEKTQKLSSVTPVVLASINIADQYFKSLDENKKLLDQLNDYNSSDENGREENSKLIEEKDKYIEELLAIVDRQKCNDSNSSNEVCKLKQSIAEKDKELEELNMLINSFQNHIYQLQIESNK
ncbi:MAG: cell division protein ZapA [Proteocatella sp.]